MHMERNEATTHLSRYSVLLTGILMLGGCVTAPATKTMPQTTSVSIKVNLPINIVENKRTPRAAVDDCRKPNTSCDTYTLATGGTTAAFSDGARHIIPSGSAMIVLELAGLQNTGRDLTRFVEEVGDYTRAREIIALSARLFRTAAIAKTVDTYPVYDGADVAVIRVDILSAEVDRLIQEGQLVCDTSGCDLPIPLFFCTNRSKCDQVGKIGTNQIFAQENLYAVADELLALSERSYQATEHSFLNELR